MKATFLGLLLLMSVQWSFAQQTNSGSSSFDKTKEQEPILVQEQGSFAIGGKVITTPGTFDPIKQGAYNPLGADPTGQTLHGDHASVMYQIPVKSRKYPIIFWHGHGESFKCWQTTPDGREGFQNIFLRKKFSVYLIDQPRRGHASRSTQPFTINAIPDEQLWFGIFRLGVWPDFYPGVQFSKDPEALNQFFRQMVPNTGPYDIAVNTDAVSALFDKIGQGILVTHSQSGGLGWRTAIKNTNIKAIVSFEPGGDFLFPEGNTIDSIVLGGRIIKPATIPLSEFLKLTKIPIIIYYGDNIPDTPSSNPGQEQWRAFYDVAKKWKEAVNKHGGNVTLIHLPDIGIKGNTHFLMSDLNNAEIADLLSSWLKEKGLDK